MSESRLRIGYIPLVDAAALIVAVDHGFAAAEGLDVDLVREVSWSNVRDKLNLGLFDAAHLLSPVAIASSLGLGHVRVPILAPFNLGLNGNAITLTPGLYAAVAAAADGDLADPLVSGRALARVVADRKQRNSDPLTFGMTFPFSNHNYQLRFWMAAAGVDPDDDVRLVVLPPPYMADSLSRGHVDGFCVGAPWNSMAVEAGIGRILHFGCDIVARCSEKVLALRSQWVAQNGDAMQRLVRALGRAAASVADPDGRDAVAATVAERISVPPTVVHRTLAGTLQLDRSGNERTDAHYLLVGGTSARPDPTQAAWLYAQMVRWGQAPMSAESLDLARGVFRPDLFDAALGVQHNGGEREPTDGIGAFVGPAFDPARIDADLAACVIRRV
jgi:NitT/TauT family transport system ATP-binding protein